MEQEHRTKILCNIDKLVKFTNYDILVRACLEQQLLFKVMVDKIQVNCGAIALIALIRFHRNSMNCDLQLETTQEARHRKLFEKITHRGPKAYEMLIKILKQHFPDAYEILTHVSYRMANYNDDEPSIRELLIRNGLANQATNSNLNNNHNHNHSQNNSRNNNNNNNYNNNNNDIHHFAVPSTSRSISPRIQELSNQLINASLGNNRMLPKRKPQIVEFKEQINPELNAHVQFSTKFHGETTSKVGICKFASHYFHLTKFTTNFFYLQIVHILQIQ